MRMGERGRLPCCGPWGGGGGWVGVCVCVCVCVCGCVGVYPRVTPNLRYGGAWQLRVTRHGFHSSNRRRGSSGGGAHRASLHHDSRVQLRELPLHGVQAAVLPLQRHRQQNAAAQQQPPY